MHFDDDDHMCVGKLQIFNMNMLIDYFCAMSFEIFSLKPVISHGGMLGLVWRLMN